MRSVRGLVVILVALAALGGCAKVQISDRQEYTGGKLPRPQHVWVYDFVATPNDVPPQSSLFGHPSVDTSAQTAEDVKLNRQVGAALANALVAEIAGMGLPAGNASASTVPSLDDLVLRGTLLSVQVGSEAERLAIGLGKGAAELKVAIEAYHMTPSGLVKLGGGTAGTEAGKGPGAAVPLAVAIATKNPIGLIVSTGVNLHAEKTGSATIEGKEQMIAKQIAAELQPRFVEQGWIAPQSK